MLTPIGFLSGKGMVAVPNLSSLTQVEALAAISAAGLVGTASGTTNTSNSSLDGKVASQSPTSGTLVDYGTSVTVNTYTYYQEQATLSFPTFSAVTRGTTTASFTITNYDAQQSYYFYGMPSGVSATNTGSSVSVTGLSQTDSFSLWTSVSRSGYNSAAASVAIEQYTVSSGDLSMNINQTGSTQTSVNLEINLGANNTGSTYGWSIKNQPDFNATTYASGTVDSYSLGTTVSTTVSGLSPGTSYTMYGFVGSTLKDTITVSTTASGTFAVSASAASAAPSQIAISWDSVANVSYYRVSIDSSIIVSNTTSTSHTTSSSYSAGIYTVDVIAYGSGGSILASGSTAVTVSASSSATVGVSASSTSSGSITATGSISGATALSWSFVAGGPNGSTINTNSNTATWTGLLSSYGYGISANAYAGVNQTGTLLGTASIGSKYADGANAPAPTPTPTPTPTPPTWYCSYRIYGSSSTSYYTSTVDESQYSCANTRTVCSQLGYQGAAAVEACPTPTPTPTPTATPTPTPTPTPGGGCDLLYCSSVHYTSNQACCAACGYVWTGSFCV
jgi:hypothetical protein